MFKRNASIYKSTMVRWIGALRHRSSKLVLTNYSGDEKSNQKLENREDAS